MNTKSPIFRSLFILLVTILSLLGAGGAFFWYTLTNQRMASAEASVATGRERSMIQSATPFVYRGIQTPPVVAAKDAKLDDAEPVIGVKVGGKYRAYKTQALAGMTHHVVNDLLGGVPISVTHCDINKCTRVFSGEGTELLQIMTGGYIDRMLLSVGGEFYYQDSSDPIHQNYPKPFPYQAFIFEETTWKAWRTAHPETDVYIVAPSDEIKEEE